MGRGGREKQERECLLASSHKQVASIASAVAYRLHRHTSVDFIHRNALAACNLDNQATRSWVLRENDSVHVRLGLSKHLEVAGESFQLCLASGGKRTARTQS